jgi:hypothetical protein
LTKRTLAAEEHRGAFNPQSGDKSEGAEEEELTGGVGANKPYFPSWKKVTEGLQVNPDEALNDAIWRHLRGQKGVGTVGAPVHVDSP